MLILSRSQDDIHRTKPFFVGTFHEPLANLAWFNRLGQDIFFISHQEDIIARDKTWQAWDNRAIKIKDINDINYQGITVSHLVQELEEIIVRQLDIRDFIIVAETETALAIDFACSKPFQELIGEYSLAPLYFLSEWALHSQYRIILPFLNSFFVYNRTIFFGHLLHDTAFTRPVDLGLDGVMLNQRLDQIERMPARWAAGYRHQLIPDHDHFIFS